MSHVSNGLVDGTGALSSEDFEARLRKLRIGASVIIVVAAASLVASVMISPVPVTFVLTGVFIGGLLAVGMSFRRSIDSGILEWVLFAVFFGSWTFLRDLLFPTMNGNFFMTFWTAMSAWALGLSLQTLPLVRFSIERKRKTIQTDQAAVRHCRESGDSAFVAQMRTSSKKMRKEFIIAQMAMASAMAGFGIYVWLFEDSLIGLLLVLMMVPPIAMFAWMLKLRGGG